MYCRLAGDQGNDQLVTRRDWGALQALLACQLATLVRMHFCNLRGIAGKCCRFGGINVDWCICAMLMHCPFPLTLTTQAMQCGQLAG